MPIRNCSKVKFLRKLVFPGGNDDKDKCIRKAYLDFCRTLTALSNWPNKLALYDASKYRIENFIEAIMTRKFDGQDVFDNTHKDCCMELINIFQHANYKVFHVGHAQKWLNMTLKYLFVLMDDPGSTFLHNMQYFHATIDNTIIDRLTDIYNIEIQKPWTKINDYEVYLSSQKDIRKHCQQRSPFELEFDLWNGR